MRRSYLLAGSRGALITSDNLMGEIAVDIIGNLKRIAGEIMNEEQEFETYELLGNGRVDIAKEYLLGRVDVLYLRGDMDLLKASHYYSVIDPTPERARMFPQKQVAC